MDAQSLLLDRLREAIPTGGAVCLVGAGFSTAALDQNGRTIPSSQELIEEIKSRIGLDASEQASLVRQIRLRKRKDNISKSIGCRTFGKRSPRDLHIVACSRSVFRNRLPTRIESENCVLN